MQGLCVIDVIDIEGDSSSARDLYITKKSRFFEKVAIKSLKIVRRIEKHTSWRFSKYADFLNLNKSFTSREAMRESHLIVIKMTFSIL